MVRDRLHERTHTQIWVLLGVAIGDYHVANMISIHHRKPVPAPVKGVAELRASPRALGPIGAWAKPNIHPGTDIKRSICWTIRKVQRLALTGKLGIAPRSKGPKIRPIDPVVDTIPQAAYPKLRVGLGKSREHH